MIHRLIQAWQSDIRWRVYAAIVFVVLASSTLYTLYTIRVLEREASEALEERASGLVEVLSSTLARPMFDINDQAVQSVVNAVGATPDLSYLAVFSPDGLVQAQKGSEPNDPTYRGIQSSLPVVYKEAERVYTVGRVDLALLAQSTERELRQRVMQVVMANLMLAAAIIGLLVLLGRQMARPLADIQQALQRLASGQTDIELSGRNRADQIGQLSRAVWMFKEALQRLHATEKQLHQARLQAIVDTSTDAVILTDRAGRILNWTERATAILGWNTERAMGQPLLDLLQPLNDAGQPPTDLLHGAGTTAWQPPRFQFETTVSCQDGRRLPVEWSIGLLADDQVQPDAQQVCVFLRDLTHRRQAEDEVRLALTKKAELYELRAKFIAMASHEFRTPLTSILSSVEILRHYRNKLDPSEQSQLLGTIESGVDRMTRMLDRVLIIGKADADKLEFAPREVDLPALCAELVLEARAQCPDSACTIQQQCPPNGCRARLDPDLLRHILGNLLSNALKYSPQGGNVTLAVQAEREGWSFQVSDQGIGIPPADLPHVFATFHRCTNVADIAGTGLGLAIAERAVHLHGGHVSVESTQGAGTTFTVWLPGA